MDEWCIERLARSHERREFSCGKESLDAFLRSLVSQYEKRSLGRTYVAIKSGEKQIRGYYTLASGALSFETLPTEVAKNLPRHSIPVILLARLAVDHSVQGQGLGGLLLGDALSRCLGLAEQVGIHGVEVDAIDEEARTFYQKHGFICLLDNPLHLFLPIATIKASIAGKARPGKRK